MDPCIARHTNRSGAGAPGELIARSTGAFGAGNLPVLIHDVVLPRRAKGRAHAEACFTLESAGQPLLVVHDGVHWQVEHRQLHPARDIHTDGVRDDGVMRSQHAPDWQAVPDMRIWHQRARHGDGKLAGVLHLLQSLGFEIGAPYSIGSVPLPRLESAAGGDVIQQFSRQLPIALVADERLR